MSNPAHRVYTPLEWQRITQSVEQLPEDSPLVFVLHDYLDLWDKLTMTPKN